jgi:hypothetical protein
MKVIRPHPLKLAVASLFCVAPLLCSAPAQAERSDVYLTDTTGQPVRASADCVQTSSWRQGFRFADCEPAPVLEAPAPDEPKRRRRPRDALSYLAKRSATAGI